MISFLMRSDEYKTHILEYFKKNMAKGYSPDTLKWSLIKQGYSRSIVDWAVEEMHKEMAKTAPLLKEKPEIKYEAVEEVSVSQPKRSWWKRLFGVE
jgi:hypothetical protein